MSVAVRRGSALGLILALLFAFVGGGGVPLYADPIPIPNPPIPTLSGWDAPPDGEPQRTYEYPSLEFWRDEITWDSPKLGTPYLNRLKGRDAYRGQVGTEEHLLSAWKDYAKRISLAQWETLTNGQKQAVWEEYLNKYIGILGNNAKGKAFEEFYAKQFKLNEAGYKLDSRFPGISSRRRGDAFTTDEGGVLLEFKSGTSEIDRAQARFLAEQAIRLKKTLVYVFGDEPLEKDLKFLEELSAELAPTTEANQARIAAGKEVEPLIVHRRWPATGKQVRHANAPPPPSGPGEPEPAGPSSGGPGSLGVGRQQLSDTASMRDVANSPSSPEAAAALAELAQDLAQELGYEDPADADMADEQLGGVDFSTLELRYVSDTNNSALETGVQYSYQVAAKPGTEVSFGGRQAAQQASDSFFVWLALPSDSFTVNLNPNEPDRIIDSKFGQTDAGRVLLQADLQLKKTTATLIHPDTALGAQFWSSLEGTDSSSSCFSFRTWIVPAPASVREDYDKLYILDAPLSVKMEADYIKGLSAANQSSCPKQDAAVDQHNEDLFRSMILPEIERAVNGAPEYQDLRRVYYSRVAAQWIRDRSATSKTAYSNIVNSDNVSSWPSRQAWNPQDVYQQYVKSYRDGEFNVTHQTDKGDYIETDTYIFGGVDFSNVPFNEIGQAGFQQQWPDRPAAMAASTKHPYADQTGAAWIGGIVADEEQPATPTSAAADSAPLMPVPDEATANESASSPPTLVIAVVAVLFIILLLLWLRERTRGAVGVVAQTGQDPHRGTSAGRRGWPRFPRRPPSAGPP